MAKTYEEVVYAEECDALALELKAVLDEVKVPDGRVRRAILAAAIVTAAQLVDGNSMPEDTDVIRSGGVAECVKQILEGAK